MALLMAGDLRLNVIEDGTPSGQPVVFCNPLGCDLTLWDQIIPELPAGLRLIRFDLRGQGGSDCPPSPYRMGQLITDTEQLLDRLGLRDAVLVGLGLGGMIAQGLATKRLDQVRALVLSGTAPRIGVASHWDRRGLLALAEGMQPVLSETLPRWFPPRHRHGPAARIWQEMLLAQSPEGYAGACAAIAGTDFYTTTAALRLPCLVLAGSGDGATPPDLVRELAGLIPGSEFRLLRGAGHLPPLDSPDAFTAELARFLKQIGHCDAPPEESAPAAADH